jgi:hypothetical protein
MYPSFEQVLIVHLGRLLESTTEVVKRHSLAGIREPVDVWCRECVDRDLPWTRPMNGFVVAILAVREFQVGSDLKFHYPSKQLEPLELF